MTHAGNISLVSSAISFPFSEETLWTMAPISNISLLNKVFFVLCLLSRLGTTPSNTRANADPTGIDNASVVSNHVDVMINETTTGQEQLIGKIKYFYSYDPNETDVSKNESPCSDIVVMGVGTAMKVDDYDALSQRVVEKAPGMVFIVSDSNPGRMIKLSPEQYALLFKNIQQRVGEWIPICRDDANTTNTKQRNFFIGGHSASGQAALVAAQQKLYGETSAPNGFIGLDPYDISSKTMVENSPFQIPTLDWGFTKTTCLVGVDKAAKGAYDYSSPSMGRVLYRVDNANDDGRSVFDNGSTDTIEHCVFTDEGCGVGFITVCPTESNQTNRDVLFDAIAESIQIFVTVVREQQQEQEQEEQPGNSSASSPFSKQQFVPPVETYTSANQAQNNIFLYVGNDIVMVEGTAEEEEKAQPSLPSQEQEQSSSTSDQMVVSRLLGGILVSLVFSTFI